MYNFEKTTGLVIRKRAYIISVLCLIFAYFGFTTENIYFSVIGLFCICCSAFICNENECFCIMLVCLPNARICRLYGYTFHTFFICFFIIKQIVNYFYQNESNTIKISNKIANVLICALLLFFSVLITICLNKNFKDGLSVFTFLLNIVAYCLLFHNQLDLNILGHYVGAIVLGCLFSFLFLLINNNFYLVLGSDIRYAALGDDPNYTAATMLLGITGILVMLFLDGKNIIFRLICCAILFFYGILTQSRGFLISILFVIILLLILISNSKKSLKYKVGIILGICIIGILMFFAMYDVFLQAIDRFFEKGDISSGRLELWREALSQWFKIETFFFGCGEIYNYTDSTKFPTVQHNAYLELLTNYGFVGFVLYVLLMIQVLFFIISKCSKTKKAKFRFIFILGPFMCAFFFLNGIFTDGFILGIMLLMTLMVFANNKEDRGY